MNAYIADICDQDPNCDRITVVGTRIFTWMGAGLSPAYVTPKPNVARIGPEDAFQVFLRNIPKSWQRGDDDVNCASLEVVRQAEAGNQAGPYITIGSLRKAFKINYGNGESEIFILTELSTMGFKPVFGTCG